MKKRLMSLVLCLVMVFSLFPLAALAADSNTNPDGDSEYIAAWHTSPVFLNKDSDSSQAVSALSALRERTFRTRVQLTMVGDGSKVQLTYSNKYGTADLEIGEITLAKGVASDINKITGRIASIKASQLSPSAAWEGNVVRTNTSYYGHTVWVIPAGQTVKTKPIDISALGLSAMDYLTVSTWVTNMHHFSEGFTAGLTGGRTAYLGLTNTSGSYNHTHAEDLDDVGIISPVELTRSDNTGDYNVIPFLTEIDVKRANPNQYATVLFGDSTLANDVPTLLGSRLKANDIQGVAFVSSAIKGNELLLDGQNASDDNNGSLLGDAGKTRINPDALNLPGVKKVIVKLGINDILHPYCSNLAQNYTELPTAQDIIDGYQILIDAAHAQNVEIYFYDLSPWQSESKTYTREGTLDTTKAAEIEAVRTAVNAWLAENGNDYDDFSTFGYIPLEDMNVTGTEKLRDAFTTDGIHYTKNGQNQVSKLTPLSIFWKNTDVESNTAGEQVQIHDIYCATGTGTAPMDGEVYYLVNDLGYLANDTSSQYALSQNNEYTASAATALDRETTDDEGKRYNDDATSHVVSTNVVVQRGVDDVPYIVGTGVPAAAQWQCLKEGNNYFWLNSGTNRFMTWYYTGGVATRHRFSLGMKSIQGGTSSGFWNAMTSGNEGWYTLNKSSDVDRTSTIVLGQEINPRAYFTFDDGQYGNYLYYDGSISDKYLTCYNNTWQIINGSFFGDYKSRVESLVIFNSQYGTTIDCKMDLDTRNVNGTASDDGNRFTLNNSNDSFRLYYILSSNLGESSDMQSHVNYAALNNNGNNPVGPYAGYTFGYDQAMYWMSSNPDVATVDKNEVKASATATAAESGGLVQMTGEPGETLVTLNFFWKEYDGTNYYFNEVSEDVYNANVANNDADGVKWVQIDNNKFIETNMHWLKSEVEIVNITDYSTDIMIDNQLVDVYDKVDVVDGDTSSLEALKITKPDGIDYLDGHWVWNSSDETVATISQDGSEFATLNYTGKTGSTDVTVTFVDENDQPISYNGHVITDTITVNTTEKPVTVDIKIKGEVTDYYINETAGAGIKIPLEAFIDYGTITDGSWSWKVYDETAEESPAVISLDNETARTPIATVNGEGLAYAVVTYSYTDTAGQPQTATNTVAFIIKFVTNTKQVVIDFGAKYELDSDVYSYEPVNGAVGFDLSDVPGKLTFTTPFTKNEKAYDFTAFNAAESATYNTKAVKTSDETVFNQVTVVPASNIYYSDSLNGKTLTPNDQIGYNAGVTYTDPAVQSGTYTFTFKGQRVDVYCTNKAESGTVAVTLANGENTQKKLIQMREDENIVRGNAPTVSFGDLNGEVVSTLTIVASSSAKFRLEGVRVYNANSANAAVEPGAQYINLRDKILDEPDAVTLTGTTQGILFIDGDTFDYKNNGPKNEVYLAQNQAVAFEVPTGTTGVMVAVRTPSNDSGTVKLNGEEKTVSKMDMYYPVNLQDNSVTIQNNGTNLISVTNVKLVGDFESTTPGDEGARSLSVSPQLKTFAARMMAGDTVETPDDPGTPENPQPTQQPTIQQLLQQLLSQFVKNLFSSISRLFGN